MGLACVLAAGTMFLNGCWLNTLGTNRLFFSAKKVVFGSTLVGAESLPQVVELVNLGSRPLAVGKISVSGSGATAFRIDSRCGTQLAGRSRCSLLVTFTPPDTGVSTAELQVEEGSTAKLESVPVSGAGALDASADVVVYGATPAGVMAAVAAGRRGRSVVLIEPTHRVGGMMSNGLGASDFFPGEVLGGVPKQFFARMQAYYGKDPLSQKGKRFEPHVAEQGFLTLLEEETRISGEIGVGLQSVVKTGTTVTGLELEDGALVHGKEFIDASYTGDVLAAAGVSYTVGREAQSEYGEKTAGVGLPIQLGNRPVSSYVIAGDAGSGLLPHVSDAVVDAVGSADKTVMGYNYRLCLSSDKANQIPIEPPANYDAKEFELAARVITASNPKYGLLELLNLGTLPNEKFDLNNSTASFSMDEIGVNYAYPDGSKEARAAIEAEVKRYMQGMLTFLRTDEQVPEVVRAKLNSLGLCKDEFTDNAGWPNQIYVREARRMVGDYVFNSADVDGQVAVPDAIGVGGYPSDDHIHQIVSLRGQVVREFSRGYNPPLYAIPYRVLTPKETEVTNLLVPVAVSASHVMFDSLRVEQTWMTMGEAAGAAAVLAINEGVAVQRIDTGVLQQLLAGEGVKVAP